MNLRELVIDLLDDDHGVNSKAHDKLTKICEQNGWHDIIHATELQDERAFLNEEDAAILRNK